MILRGPFCFQNQKASEKNTIDSNSAFTCLGHLGKLFHWCRVATTLSKMKFSITTVCIGQICDTQHKRWWNKWPSALQISVTMLNEVFLFIVMLNVILQGVGILNVIVLNVVEPRLVRPLMFSQKSGQCKRHFVNTDTYYQKLWSSISGSGWVGPWFFIS